MNVKPKRGVSHPSWLRPALVPPTLVFGPPCAGKTTYVKKNKRLGDIVIDLDVIVKQLTGLDRHQWTKENLDEALWERNTQIRKLSLNRRKAWIILTEPKSAWRRWWKTKLNTSDVVLLDTPLDVCLSRTNSDEIREAIYDWWTKYAEDIEKTNTTA
jgi:predicted kinase